MTVSAELFFDKSFVLKADDLQKLAKTFACHIGPPEFALECSDGLTRTFHTSNDVIGYENPAAKRITSLRIRAYSPKVEERATLGISTKGNNAFFLLMEGDEEHIRPLKEEIDDRIAGMRPWYSWLSRIDFIALGFGAFACVYFALLVILAVSKLQNPPPSTNLPRDVAIGILIAFGSFTVVFAGGWLCNRLRGSIFPKGAFAIGQGEERFHRQEKFRWAVIVGFVVSLLAGVPFILLR